MVRRWGPLTLHLGWRAFLATVLVALVLPSGGVSTLIATSDLAAPDYSRSAPLSGAVVATEHLSPRATAPQSYSHPAVAGMSATVLAANVGPGYVRGAGSSTAGTRDTTARSARAPPSTLI
jgi:hypothetical protein